MDNARLRQKFEAWVKNPHKLNRSSEPGHEDQYEHPWTAGAWEACQAFYIAGLREAAGICAAENWEADSGDCIGSINKRITELEKGR